MNRTAEDGNRGKWYEKYLPFVAKSPRMQVDWLVAAFRKKILTHEEITPYIRLLLADGQENEVIKVLFQCLDEETITEMLEAADIYDIPRLFRMIANPSLGQARIALRKTPPPYEKTPAQVRYKIFQAVYDTSEDLLKQTVEDMKKRGEISAEFEEAYERFNEILMDARILSTLYPRAKIQPGS